MSLHQLLANSAQAFPDRVALVHRSIHVTWARLADRVARRAGQLAGMGLQPGKRVAVLAANVPEHLEAQFAVPWAGLVLVPINTRLSPAEQQYILAHSQCRLLFADERNAGQAETLARAVPGLQICHLEPITTWDTPGDSLTGRDRHPYQPTRADSPAAIFYTGGTTGRPKGVELSHTALLLQGLGAKDNYRFDEDTVFMHTAPMFHLADFAASLGAIAAGASHSFLPEFSAASVLDGVDDEGVNTVIMVPTMIGTLLDAASTRRATLLKLHTILYGAAPIQEPLLLRLLNEAPGVRLIQVYGQTEVGGACTFLPARYHVADGPDSDKLASAGRPMPAFLVQVVDDDGQAVPAGTPGEIWVSGPGVMTSYWNEPELTRLALRDGWLRTGDLGVLDAEGFLSIVGRLKDLIITGGENVFGGEVESALMHHPAVDSAAVIGVPDPKWGEAVHAVVVLKHGQSATADELIAHCRERIAHYKCPRSLTLRDRPLPLSGVGKVRKVDLQREWKEAHEQGAAR